MKKVVLITLLIFVICKKTPPPLQVNQPIVEKEKILLVTDVNLYENTKPYEENKIIGKCLKGSIIDILEDISYPDPKTDNFNWVWKKVECNNFFGYISYEWGIYVYGTNKFLTENKEKLYELYDYFIEMQASYRFGQLTIGVIVSSGSQNLTVEFYSDDLKVLHKFRIQKVKPYEYILKNDLTELKLQKNKFILKITVINDQTNDFLQYHNKKLREYRYKHPASFEYVISKKIIK